MEKRRPILMREGFTIERGDSYWKTELYLIDHEGFHNMACDYNIL